MPPGFVCPGKWTHGHRGPCHMQKSAILHEDKMPVKGLEALTSAPAGRSARFGVSSFRIETNPKAASDFSVVRNATSCTPSFRSAFPSTKQNSLLSFIRECASPSNTHLRSGSWTRTAAPSIWIERRMATPERCTRIPMSWRPSIRFYLAMRNVRTVCSRGRTGPLFATKRRRRRNLIIDRGSNWPPPKRRSHASPGTASATLSVPRWPWQAPLQERSWKRPGTRRSARLRVLSSLAPAHKVGFGLDRPDRHRILQHAPKHAPKEFSESAARGEVSK
jgi:hypothetical protein